MRLFLAVALKTRHDEGRKRVRLRHTGETSRPGFGGPFQRPNTERVASNNIQAPPSVRDQVKQKTTHIRGLVIDTPTRSTSLPARVESIVDRAQTEGVESHQRSAILDKSFSGVTHVAPSLCSIVHNTRVERGNSVFRCQPEYKRFRNPLISHEGANYACSWACTKLALSARTKCALL